MRTYDEYRQILELWEQHIPKKRIGLMLNIPRGTVTDCIRRYGSLAELEANKEWASRNTPNEVLNRVQDVQHTEIQRAYAYVLGIYLGDGSIGRARQIYRLRISLDAHYPNIIALCSKRIQMLLPDNEVGLVERDYQGRLSCVDVSSYHKFWPDLLPQHGDGPKHKREIKLEDWQLQIVNSYPLEFFRGLYHSDGSRDRNVVNDKEYPRYAFSNLSPDIQQLFCYACNLLGLHWTIASSDTSINISKRPDVAFLDQHIGPKS
ncbi:MAG TPA: hypothetical protein VHO69_13205 [Phototrophicaceae bacterium]|nr:hypothetical protein [Phototrophicaceae bacterium]